MSSSKLAGSLSESGQLQVVDMADRRLGRIWGRASPAAGRLAMRSEISGPSGPLPCVRSFPSTEISVFSGENRSMKRCQPGRARQSLDGQRRAARHFDRQALIRPAGNDPQERWPVRALECEVNRPPQAGSDRPVVMIGQLKAARGQRLVEIVRDRRSARGNSQALSFAHVWIFNQRHFAGLVVHRECSNDLEVVDEHAGHTRALKDDLHRPAEGATTSFACQLTPRRTSDWLIDRRVPESRMTSPEITRKSGGLAIEAGPGPSQWTIDPGSSGSGADPSAGTNENPEATLPLSRPGTRWAPGRSSSSFGPSRAAAPAEPAHVAVRTTANAARRPSHRTF